MVQLTLDVFSEWRRKTDEAMERHRKRNGAYAKYWWELGFRCSPLIESPNDDLSKFFPTKEMGNTWQPCDSTYTYIITEATEDTYTVVTVNDEGLDDYEFRKGDMPHWEGRNFWITR